MRLAFDRGTILALEPPPDLALAQIPGFLWDPRVEAYRAPAHLHARLVAHFTLRGVRISDAVRPPGQPAPTAFDAPPLRPYQEAALFAWDAAGRRGVVALPTGSGKTRIAVGAIARTRLRALCLAPTRVLVEQWRGALAAAGAGPVGQYGDGVRELHPVTVATFESAWRHMDTLGNQFDLLVVDEAHHFGAGVRDEALEMSAAPARLGLTATPPAAGPAADRLADLVGPTVYELMIADLAGRYLASFDAVALHLDLYADERAAYERDALCFRTAYAQFRRTTPGAAWADFVRAALRSASGRAALAAWRRAQQLLALTRAKRAALADLLRHHRDSRVLVFTADNESAYAVAREHLVMPLTCDVGRAERDEALARFRRGELRALCSARVLNEGLDVPDAEVAIVLGGTQGAREHVQRVGRLLRPAPGKRALVYELVTARTSEVRQARRRRASLAPGITAQL